MGSSFCHTFNHSPADSVVTERATFHKPVILLYFHSLIAGFLFIVCFFLRVLHNFYHASRQHRFPDTFPYIVRLDGAGEDNVLTGRSQIRTSSTRFPHDRISVRVTETIAVCHPKTTGPRMDALQPYAPRDAQPGCAEPFARTRDSWE